jgi:hypothetical protein
MVGHAITLLNSRKAACQQERQHDADCQYTSND